VAYGYPQVMANDVGGLSPGLSHDDAIWDSLPEDEIMKRLAFFQTWWERQSYQPLDRGGNAIPKRPEPDRA